VRSALDCWRDARGAATLLSIGAGSVLATFLVAMSLYSGAPYNYSAAAGNYCLTGRSGP
jgi:hypothetical protein